MTCLGFVEMTYIRQMYSLLFFKKQTKKKLISLNVEVRNACINVTYVKTGQ